jgi:hypothetical protein
VSGATKTASRDAFRAAFVRHGVLSLQAAVALGVSAAAPDTRRGRARGASSLDAVAAIATSREPMATATVRDLSVPGARFGVAGPIRIQAPGDVKRFAVSPAAPDLGSLAPSTVETAVTVFLEDLFRRGRIEMTASPDTEHAIRHPFARRTHELVRRNSEMQLVRRCFDCGFDQSPSGA